MVKYEMLEDAAIKAMQAVIIRNGPPDGGTMPDTAALAKEAVEYADALCAAVDKFKADAPKTGRYELL